MEGVLPCFERGVFTVKSATFDVLNINLVNAICDHSTSDEACDNGQKFLGENR